MRNWSDFKFFPVFFNLQFLVLSKVIRPMAASQNGNEEGSHLNSKEEQLECFKKKPNRMNQLSTF